MAGTAHPAHLLTHMHSYMHAHSNKHAHTCGLCQFTALLATPPLVNLLLATMLPLNPAMAVDFALKGHY
eukprot:655531-Pelagomonas_calceolata.AAC.2